VDTLLAFSRAVDWITDRLGKLTVWCVLIAVLVSAANAGVRYAFDTSSNAWLEIQWYLFSAIFLLSAGYTLSRDEHVRIDVISGHLSRRTRIWIDVLGSIFFLLPMTITVVWSAWPFFLDSFQRHEVSGNAGGLVRWPVKLLIPVGFALLGLQGISEVIKRVAILLGRIPDPTAKEAEPRPDPAATKPV
jgi:TRAP-type mannitol/chloroaromatic compound transport system permease small subunit